MHVNRRAFTLIEIMIVVAIIGVLAAISIPGFVRARSITNRNTCIANLKQVQGAVQLWAIDSASGSGVLPDQSDIVPAYLRSWPVCLGTAYDVPAVDQTPSCPNVATFPDHSL